MFLALNAFLKPKKPTNRHLMLQTFYYFLDKYILQNQDKKYLPIIINTINLVEKVIFFLYIPLLCEFAAYISHLPFSSQWIWLWPLFTRGTWTWCSYCVDSAGTGFDDISRCTKTPAGLWRIIRAFISFVCRHLVRGSRKRLATRAC